MWRAMMRFAAFSLYVASADWMGIAVRKAGGDTVTVGHRCELVVPTFWRVVVLTVLGTLRWIRLTTHSDITDVVSWRTKITLRVDVT
jgi:hypothetical protein